ncbi:MAG TPA: serine/threonine-protein kinase, partial [Kofleriaceae bacterium]|nr:serine/threonine-protein kinase [Kofleriaceae bacterium]
MAAPDDDPHRTLTAAGSGAPAAAREARREPGDIRPGDRFSRYIVQRLIGEGGMGRVFAAVDTQLGRTIALKVINRRHLESPTSRPRLLREAQALALLHHPNVVTVHDIGSEVDRVFIAMELVEGPTLSTWLKAAPRTWRDTLRTLLAAGRGLAAAHAASIIHRDFKPANVIVGHDRVVVVDFGLARAGDDAPDAAVSSRAETVSDPAIDHAMLEVSLTEHGARIGTAGYMAPEQLGGRPVTGKVDQFAFCVALWEALWGARPLPPGVGIDDDHAPPAVALAGVPSRVRDIVSRGLAADPARRWPDLPALLAALERCLVRRSRIAIGAVLLGAALAVGVAGWIIERGHAERRLAAAQQLAREAEVVRGHMRASRLLPPHDIEIDRQAVRAQIARITEEMAAIGDDARGPGEFALGAAWLSLGDGRDVRAQALVHLEAAWAAGERSPELAFDLGSALARTYQDALLRVPPVAERAQLEADLQHRLRDPALVYLRQARGADTSPDFLEALIAVTEGRWDDAIARGEAALREVPTLYEAGLLVAHALQKQANAAMVAGAPAQADGLYDRMAAIYHHIIN